MKNHGITPDFCNTVGSLNVNQMLILRIFLNDCYHSLIINFSIVSNMRFIRTWPYIDYFLDLIFIDGAFQRLTRIEALTCLNRIRIILDKNCLVANNFRCQVIAVLKLNYDDLCLFGYTSKGRSSEFELELLSQVFKAWHL